MAKNDITGFEFPVFDAEGKIQSTELRLYDYNSLANIPETCVTETSTKYTVDNTVRVTENLEVDGNVEIEGAITGNLVISSDSFGESLPTTQPRVAGRIFFVKLQD